jgi:TetR/AcrR family transcriptional regulator, regulator of cefoperazone and chloramphenicol sensitivity
MNDSSYPDPTRNRVLVAAVEIFAAHGFRETTVREICAKADVNIASVNYHFRNKASLYKEALAFAFMQADQRYPLDEAKDAKLSAEQRLSNFIRIFLHKLTDDTHLGHHGKLIAREIADPTDALDDIIKIAIVPQFEILSKVVPELVGPSCSGDDIHRCVLGILGQCLMYKHSRSIIDRICPEVIGSLEEIDNTAAHIARFSLAAFKQLAANPSKR